MRISQLTGVLLFSLLLSACVTTTDSRFTKKASPEKAVESYVALGVGYLRSGDMVMARRKIERALEIDSESALAHNAMGMFWQARNEPHLAEKEFKIALEIDSAFSPANYHYGRFLLASGNTAQACDFLKRSTEDVDYPGRVTAFEDLGLCYYARQETDQAIRALEKAWQLETDSTVATLNLAQIYVDKKRFDLAQRWFNRFEKTILQHKVDHNAQSLWIAVQIARANRDKNAEAKYAFKLKKSYPNSQEYQLFLNSWKRKK